MLGVAAAGLFAVGYGLGQRAAAVAAMLVTAAAFPIAVKQMEESGSKAAMQQLSENSALLIAILAPSIVGIFMLRADIVHLLIAAPFQQVTPCCSSVVSPCWCDPQFACAFRRSGVSAP